MQKRRHQMIPGDLHPHARPPEREIYRKPSLTAFGQRNREESCHE